MSIESSTVARIAALARLTIAAEETAGYQADLGAILALVEQINAAPTTDVTPLAHPLELTARLRPDEVTESDQRDGFQSIAPLVERGLYLVPRVID